MQIELRGKCDSCGVMWTIWGPNHATFETLSQTLQAAKQYDVDDVICRKCGEPDLVARFVDGEQHDPWRSPLTVWQ